jgi:hypothetical protein
MVVMCVCNNNQQKYNNGTYLNKMQDQSIQEITQNTSDLILFIIMVVLIQNGQIWNTYKIVEYLVTKIQYRRRSSLPKASPSYRPKTQMNQFITHLKYEDLPSTMHPSLADANQEFGLQ